MTQKERWKDIPNYENLYQISNYGNVKSLNYDRTGKYGYMKPSVSTMGYYYLNLCKNRRIKRFFVHTLVALTYLENKNNLKEINHINGVKTDNRVENLEWCTHKDNMLHAFKNKLAHYPVPKYGKENHKSKRVKQFDLNGNFIKEWECIRDASKIINGNNHICDVCLGKRKTAGGYVWEYSD